MPIYDHQQYVPDFLELRFFDHTGQISFAHWGSSLFLDSQEVLSVSPSPKWAPETVQTAGGFGFSSGVVAPDKWAFEVREYNQYTHAKVAILHEAVENGWRIWARVKGLFTFNRQTGNTLPAQTIMNRAVLKFDHAPYREIMRGLGPVHETAKKFELWESVDMALPVADQVVAITANGGGEVVILPIGNLGNGAYYILQPPVTR